MARMVSTQNKFHLMNQTNESLDVQKHQQIAFLVIEIIEHNPGLAPVKTVIRKINEDVTSSRFASDDVFNEHTTSKEILMHLASGHARICRVCWCRDRA